METPMEQFISHFSHRHPLLISDVVEDDDQVICSGCEHDLSGGAAYTCSKNNCNFVLHDSCFELPRKIKHEAHPKHHLSLLFSPPYTDGEFTCDACGDSGHAFTYHCEKCKFDLHVECASLPEIEDRKDHQHPLTLCYGNTADDMMMCYVCGTSLGKSCWFYCCLACKCGTHLDCGVNQEIGIVVSEI